MANKWPNKERGRTCLLGFKRTVEIEDFYRNKHQVTSQQDLFNVYEISEKQRIEKSTAQLQMMGGISTSGMAPDPYSDWLIKRGICPHALIETNSRYHFETCVMLDSEMGLKLPDPKLSIGETPALFFQALAIIRSARSKVKQEEDAKNNNHTDNR